jgi:hypothetical protein
MNILQVKETGKPFQRSTWRENYWVEYLNGMFIECMTGGQVGLAADDIFANDWIPFEEKTIRLRDLTKALNEAKEQSVNVSAETVWKHL